MKKLILGAALCVVAAACTSSKTSSVSDAEKANVKSECATSCSTATKTSCSGEAKTDCSTKVCPITGKTMN